MNTTPKAVLKDGALNPIIPGKWRSRCRWGDNVCEYSIGNSGNIYVNFPDLLLGKEIPEAIAPHLKLSYHLN